MTARALIQKTAHAGLRILPSEKFGKAALLVGVLTMTSRLVGLVRTRLMTSKFGAGEVLDVYYASFRLPDLLMGIFIVGTLSLAVLPVITKYLVKTPEKTDELVSRVLNWVFVCMGLASLLCVLLAPWLVRLLAPGFSGEAFTSAVLLTRLVLSVQAFVALANVMTTVLNATKRFFWSYTAPILYNVGIIVGVVWFYPIFGIVGLGYGVVLGAAMYFVALLVALLHAGFRWHFHALRTKGENEVLKLYLPRLLMFDLSQVSLLLATFFGSFLVAGSISVFNLGFDLQAVPVGVVAVASAVAVFPHLAEQFVKGNLNKYLELLTLAVARIIYFIAPISVLLLVFRAQVVRLVYGAGRFDWNDTTATFTVLGILTFSLLGQSLVPLFARAMLARNMTWAPVWANFFAILIQLAVAWFVTPGMGVGGVALSYVVAITFNALVLYVWLRRAISREAGELAEEISKKELWLQLEIWKMLLGVMVLAVVSYGLMYAVEPLVNTHTWLGLAMQTAFAAGVGALVYLGLTWIIGVGEARTFARGILAFLKRR